MYELNNTHHESLVLSVWSSSQCNPVCVHQTPRRINPWKAAGSVQTNWHTSSCIYLTLHWARWSYPSVSRKLPSPVYQMKPTCHCLNDYHPIPLTPVIMKCSKSLVRDHIKSLLPLSLSGVLQKLFHLSLNQERILVLLKTSFLFSVPKNWTPSGLSDYRPAALRPFLVHLRPHMKSLFAVSTFTPRWTWQHCENHWTERPTVMLLKRRGWANSILFTGKPKLESKLLLR